MIIEKDIARLSINTYVTGIVRQTGNYRIKQPGWVKSLEAIEFLIEQGVERVYVDTSKRMENALEASENKSELAPGDEKNNSSKGKSTAGNADEKSLAENEDKPNYKTADFGVQLEKAKTVFDEAKSIQQKIFDDITSGNTVEIASARTITDQTTQLIFENSDAMACVINIRHKDEYLLEHSVSVSILMAMFCDYLDIPIDITKELALGAFLHDVGKIMIPDRVLNKPGKLTDAEFTIIKTHVSHSIKIIGESSGVSELAMEVAAMHHEKLNGTGYPHKLIGEQISRYGRMISICDIYDALTANRVYKDGMAQIKAFAILREMASTGALDARLVDQFIRCLGVYPVGSLVQLASNRLAIVGSHNTDNPIKPKVKAFYSIQQDLFLQTDDIDLAVTDKEKIVKGVRADDFELDMNKILETLMMEA